MTIGTEGEKVCFKRGYHRFEEFETAGDTLDYVEISSECEDCEIHFRGEMK